LINKAQKMPGDVILDTNVFVAAGFNKRSASANLLDRVRSGELRMIWNKATRAEIEHILGQIPGLSRRDAKKLFRREGHFRGRTHPHRFRYVPDPADRKFAALADASKTPLVSSDDDLLAGRRRARIPIQTPVEFRKSEKS
jgi:predicted nucleic acid-binding protein